MDENDRLRRLHELIEEAVRLQQESQALVVELSRHIAEAKWTAHKIDRRKKPRT
jgi:hypothetical protein